MGVLAVLFSFYLFSMFIVTCRLCIIHVREDNDTNIYVIVTRYGTDVLCLKKADKLTHSHDLLQ